MSYSHLHSNMYAMFTYMKPYFDPDMKFQECFVTTDMNYFFILCVFKPAEQHFPNLRDTLLGSSAGREKAF